MAHRNPRKMERHLPTNNHNINNLLFFTPARRIDNFFILHALKGEAADEDTAVISKKRTKFLIIVFGFILRHTHTQIAQSFDSKM